MIAEMLVIVLKYKFKGRKEKGIPFPTHKMNHWKWWWKHSQIYRKYESEISSDKEMPFKNHEQSFN
ncbi:hypothetical protein NQ315_013187 [Exocentrus adspersus]|uniref:Uncharacterized protein n=1 Tax=Exocentrus adspersus TaxID=1586481 RepID=A0AAV8VAN5_9CUCU|nr:hypothetical protein NQ315_008202 [Exocentrus adspersus]KAJ8912138.1 hypothetical protein NQ315_013187 [Exocentrus adspersus]